MSTSVGSGNDGGSGLVELTSNIGTWVAAGIAIFALVGVVGPILALQASMSDKNRAMNAVQDQGQKYVSRGFPLTKRLRIFRRIRVPDLSPGYINNTPDRTSLIPPHIAALGIWALTRRDYLPWNTGWAKFAELIEAYEVRNEFIHDGLVNLGVQKKGGTLEVVNSRTALVVNKQWVLILGLLGRYGKRDDKGILERTTLRRDFDGERASIRHFVLNPISERLPPGSSEGSSRGLGSIKESDGTHDMVIAVRRSPYGTITLEAAPQPTLYGITGSMQQLGRHKGSWSYLTSISFIPHTSREILHPEIQKKCESSSLQTLFWLAHGFILLSSIVDGKQTVISLETPEPQFETRDYLDDNMEEWPAYALKTSRHIPISIGNAMQALGIPETIILQFEPIAQEAEPGQLCNTNRNTTRSNTSLRASSTAPGRHERSHDEIPHLQSRLFGKSGSAGLSGPSHSSASSASSEMSGMSVGSDIHVEGSWVYYSRPSQNHCYALQRQNVEKVLEVIIALKWDDWGYLIWKDAFWTSLINNALGILKEEELCKSPFAKSSGLAAHKRFFKRTQRQSCDPKSLAYDKALDRFLEGYLREHGLVPVKSGLGVLYILDKSLQDMTLKASSRLCEKQEEEDEVQPAGLGEIKSLEDRLEGVQKEYWNKKNLQKNATSFEPGSSTESHGGFTEEGVGRVEGGGIGEGALEIDDETLDVFGIEHDKRSVRSVISSMQDWERSFLAAYTDLSHQLRHKLGGIVEFNYNLSELRWYPDQRNMNRFHYWPLKMNSEARTDRRASMWLQEQDLVIVALWVANRAAMWIRAQDSKPLLEFINDLDSYLYIL